MNSTKPSSRVHVFLFALSVTVAFYELYAPFPEWEFMDALPEWMQNPLCALYIPYIMLHGYAYLLGTSSALLILGVVLTKPSNLTRQRRILPKPLAFALLGNLLIILQNAMFLQLPNGAEIRPMMWSAVQLGLVGCVTFWGIAAGIIYLKKGGSRIAGCLAIVLCGCSLFIGVYSTGVVMRYKELVWLQ